MSSTDDLEKQSVVSKILRRLRGIPFSPREFERSLALLGELRMLGWQASIRTGLPITRGQDPIPWITYPALDWLRRFVKPTHRVFEFGAGHSTLWFARHVAEVVAVDDDPSWTSRLRNELPQNANVLLGDIRIPEGGGPESVSEYTRSIAAYPAASFDIIVVDGMERNACCATAVPHLAPSGVILFDNSDRPGNRDGLRFLQRQGFHRVDFVGFVPGYAHLSCTSILTREPAVVFDQVEFPAFLGY